MHDRMGTVERDEDRWRLRFERVFEHPVERVWSMVTSPTGLSWWFPSRVTMEALEVGAAMRFTFSAAEIERARELGVEDFPEVSTGRVLVVEPLRVFAFEWVGEIIRIELRPAPEGCRLLLLHTFDPDREQAPKNGAGWHSCLDALEVALGGGEPLRDGPDAALMRHYAQALALPG